MANEIKQFQPASNDTLLSAKRANEVIGRLNLLSNLRVDPPAAGSFELTEGSAVLKLKSFGETRVFNYVVIEGDMVVNVAIPCTLLPDE